MCIFDTQALYNTQVHLVRLMLIALKILKHTLINTSRRDDNIILQYYAKCSPETFMNDALRK